MRNCNESDSGDSEIHANDDSTNDESSSSQGNTRDYSSISQYNHTNISANHAKHQVDNNNN